MPSIVHDVEQTYVTEIRYSQKEAYGVQNVGLAAAVEPSDGVEERVEAVDLRPLCVGFEPFNDNRLDVHPATFALGPQVPEI